MAGSFHTLSGQTIMEPQYRILELCWKRICTIHQTSMVPFNFSLLSGNWLTPLITSNANWPALTFFTVSETEEYQYIYTSNHIILPKDLFKEELVHVYKASNWTKNYQQSSRYKKAFETIIIPAGFTIAVRVHEDLHYILNLGKHLTMLMLLDFNVLMIIGIPHQSEPVE